MEGVLQVAGNTNLFERCPFKYTTWSQGNPNPESFICLCISTADAKFMMEIRGIYGDMAVNFIFLLHLEALVFIIYCI